MMNHRFFGGLLFAALVLFWTNAGGQALKVQDVLEEKEAGRVNWTQKLILAKGMMAPSDQHHNSPLDRQQTLEAAVEKGRENLLLIALDLRVDRGREVGAVFEGDAVILSKIRQMVRQAKVAEKAYMSDGTVEVVLEMKISGGFSQLVLPQEIKQIESIKTVSSGKQEPAEERADTAPAAAAFTELIVDARGLTVNPSLYFRIYDEGGQEAYGSAFISREYAVQQGVSRYVKNFEAVMQQSKNAGNPLVVKGLRTRQPHHTDVVISNADAAKIRGSSKHLSFLKQCRVSVVLD